MNRDLRKRILDLVDQLAESEHARQDFHAGQTSVPVSGKVYGSQELRFLVDASMDFWLTTGRYNSQFEKQLADFLKTRHVLTTNSGSSANLLAVSALTSPRLKDRALRAGDEVITVAAGFPT
ncbi:MAG TPA: lipopolysaccharide biosynthesis protein RfbH, partial [Flavobacteriales bacterium]|nr:lipopolysaccharide biosynthesis protein RfbH [Flavobacteriales bacterium]